MKNTNTVTIIGNLVRDPELKTTQSGKSICTFSLAVNGFNDYVSYIDCAAWEKLGNVINEHMSKGKKIAVSGELRQERWETEGGKRSRLIIVAHDVEFLSPKSGIDSMGTEVSEAPPSNPFSDDDIPF